MKRRQRWDTGAFRPRKKSGPGVSSFSALDCQLNVAPQLIAGLFFDGDEQAGSFGNVFEFADQRTTSFTSEHVRIVLKILSRPNSLGHAGLKFGAFGVA